MTSVAALTAPLPTDVSPDGVALLALERATQDRPLGLVALLAEAAPDVDGVVLVARDEDAVVGMASARLLGSEAHVIRLAVEGAHRRRGLGRALLDGLVAWASRTDARALVLEVRAGNDPALALYAVAGLVVDGRRPRYYPDGEDALLLRCPIPVDGGGR